MGIDSSTHRSYWGIDAIALDPQDDQKIYAAAGMYTNSWYVIPFILTDIPASPTHMPN